MGRHPRISLGNQWSDGSYDPHIDVLPGITAYHPDLKEILISRNVIDFVTEAFCFELSLEFIHHILNLDYGEEVCNQFEFCKEMIAVHLFCPKILKPFWLHKWLHDEDERSGGVSVEVKCIFCDNELETALSDGFHHVLPKQFIKILGLIKEWPELEKHKVPICKKCHDILTELQKPFILIIKYLRGDHQLQLGVTLPAIISRIGEIRVREEDN